MRRLLATVLLLTIAAPAIGQEPITTRYRKDGTVVVDVPLGGIIQHYGDHVVIWSKPPPPAPRPPAPGPTPEPQPGPDPEPQPPAPPPWGPLARALFLYEIDGGVDGREVFHSMAWRTLVPSLVPRDGAGHPLYLGVDDDAPVTAMGWAEARNMARRVRPDAETAPILYLFDSQGRIESIDLRRDATPDMATFEAKLKALGVTLP